MSDIELACRLLKASNLTYAISKDGTQFEPSPQTQDAISNIGLEPDSLRLFQPRSHNGIDAFYYCETANEAIIAFRGTLPPSLNPSCDFFKILSDWLNDGEIDLIKGTGLAGRVHKGFLESLDALWTRIASLDLAGLQARNKPLYVTGHSKGGAPAQLAAYRLARQNIPVDAVYTFAAPRSGDQAYAAAFNQVVGNACRFEYQDDLVPHLPPDTGAWLKVLKGMHAVQDAFPLEAPHLCLDSGIARDADQLFAQLESLAARDLSYTSAGTLQFIDWSNAIVGDSMELALERNMNLAKTMAELNFKQIIDDHASSGGYMTDICKNRA